MLPRPPESRPGRRSWAPSRMKPPTDEIWTPTSRTAVLPLLSVATICTTSVPDCSVSVRCARTVFTRASGPDRVSDGPLVDPITMPLRSVTPSVPPSSDVSVTL